MLKIDIYEDKQTGEIIIGDKRLPGEISKKLCGSCGHFLIYHDIYDAYFCPQCNQWQEGACSDPDCEYCSERPEKPL